LRRLGARVVRDPLFAGIPAAGETLAKWPSYHVASNPIPDVEEVS
jgi:hypothetical protein